MIIVQRLSYLAEQFSARECRRTPTITTPTMQTYLFSVASKQAEQPSVRRLDRVLALATAGRMLTRVPSCEHHPVLIQAAGAIHSVDM